jgi:hypothetical protein
MAESGLTPPSLSHDDIASVSTREIAGAHNTTEALDRQRGQKALEYRVGPPAKTSFQLVLQSRDDMPSLLLVIFLVQLAADLINSFGASTINELVRSSLSDMSTFANVFLAMGTLQ